MSDWQEIYDLMAAEYENRTGQRPVEGGELSVRLYAYASQIHALRLHADWVLGQCFPQTATGVQLDYHAEMRKLSRQEAQTAYGAIVFGREEPAQEDLSIPQGTVCVTEGMERFETVEPGALPAGQLTVAVRAKAQQAGQAGNIRIGALTAMTLAPVGISFCRNETPFAGGADAEDEASLRQRILESYVSMPNGANAAFYRQEALSVPGVAEASVFPRENGRGTVGVVIAAMDGLPSGALLEQVRAHLQACREIAVDVTVRAPQVDSRAISVKIEAMDLSEEIRTQAQEALQSFFTGHLLGQSVTRAALGHLLYEIPGITNYEIVSPAADWIVDADVLPAASSLTVAFMDE